MRKLPNYDRYFDYKIFEFFRDKVFSAVNEFRKDESVDNFYRHIFLAPEAASRKRAFQLQGCLYPYICFWPQSLFDWNKTFYGRSVLRRDFQYIQDGETKYCNGFLYDSTKTYRIYAASYFQEFTQQVAQDLLDLDRLRYFEIDCSELLPGFVTRCELMPKQRSQKQQVDETKSNRSFTFAAEYDLSVTYPVIDKDKFINAVEIYLDNNKIYSSLVEVI